MKPKLIKKGEKMKKLLALFMFAAFLTATACGPAVEEEAEVEDPNAIEEKIEEEVEGKLLEDEDAEEKEVEKAEKAEKEEKEDKEDKEDKE